MERKVAANNRKAFHDYTILEKYEAGLVLAGYEVKSLRQGQANLTDGFVNFSKDGAYLENVHIPPYAQQSTHILDFNSRRKRKILMHRREIKVLFDKTREKGLTLVPLELYFKDGKAKIEVAVAIGKKQYDRRESVKDREAARDVARALRRGGDR